MSPWGHGFSMRSWQPQSALVQVRMVPVSLVAMRARYPPSPARTPATAPGARPDDTEPYDVTVQRGPSTANPSGAPHRLRCDTSSAGRRAATPQRPVG